MRLVVARCEVVYTGRLTATLPDALRLLVFKADGSVLVHDDAGGYKPLNWIRSVFRPLGARVGLTRGLRLP
jgi:RecB family endonuclease NucS